MFNDLGLEHFMPPKENSWLLQWKWILAGIGCGSVEERPPNHSAVKSHNDISFRYLPKVQCLIYDLRLQGYVFVMEGCVT